MSSINHHTREINVKIVYYGPGLGGKTSSLQCLHRNLPDSQRGQLVSLATSVDRTLFFDFLPVKLPKVRDFNVRISLYTVPGQVHYNATRRLVLQGCDGVVFVADSQRARREANIESIQNLDDNLRSHGMDPEVVPVVLQYNKRDLTDLLSLEELDADLHSQPGQAYGTCALSGKGIAEALKHIIRLVLGDLKKKGIYKERDNPLKAETSGLHPVVSPTIESALGSAILEHEEAAPPPGRRLSLSELWPVDPLRGELLALEGDIERGDYDTAVARAQGALHELLGRDSESNGLVEDFLRLGVHPGHFDRYRVAVTSSSPVRADALFALFFLLDVGLRRHAARRS
ncbi:MAG: ADP-ribosylation factor-like protein [Pseudomonadota bacterium]